MIDLKKTCVFRFEVSLPDSDRVAFFNFVIGGDSSQDDLLDDFFSAFDFNPKGLSVFLVVFDCPLCEIPLVDGDFDFEDIDPFLMIKLN